MSNGDRQWPLESHSAKPQGPHVKAKHPTEHPTKRHKGVVLYGPNAVHRDLIAHHNVWHCRNLEDLFSLLEHDSVLEIVFHPAIETREREYITRWAAIFNPSLKTRRLSVGTLPVVGEVS